MSDLLLVVTPPGRVDCPLLGELSPPVEILEKCVVTCDEILDKDRHLIEILEKDVVASDEFIHQVTAESIGPKPSFARGHHVDVHLPAVKEKMGIHQVKRWPGLVKERVLLMSGAGDRPKAVAA